MGRTTRSKLSQWGFIATALALIFILAACSSNNDASSDTYPNAELLVEPDWVSEHINDENLVIIDARGKGYEDGHIQGAVHLSSGQINDPENPVKGFLLGEEEFGKLISSIGVNQDSEIVIYDDGNSLSATRIFYALEYYGLQDQVKVLNGGYAGWLVAGKEVSTDEVTVTAGNFVAKANPKLISTKSQVANELESSNFVFLDTRSEGEYTGEDVRAEQGGHIPGAVNREWTESIQEDADGVQRFKSYEVLKDEFEKIGAVRDKTVVPYCQTNVRGAHTYFALRLLGYSDIAPYEGSWSEWGNSDDVEIES